MSYLQSKVISHSMRVRSLYKKYLRNIQAFNPMPHHYRLGQAEVRARFDEHKDERDLVKAKKLLEEAEKEFEEIRHPQPIIFANSPGGVAYARDPVYPDALLDLWHPLERAQYPDYFARRHQRKLEYIERWEKKYGKEEAEKEKKKLEVKYGPLDD